MGIWTPPRIGGITIKNSKISKLKDELARAREKSADWQGRVRELERKITEQENLEILQAVRGVASTPEALRILLAQIQAAGAPPDNMKEEVHEN